jgi:hypothetical protein
VFRFQSCTSSIPRYFAFSFFLLLLIHVALNPVSSHAYSSPLNVVHTLIINSLHMTQVVSFLSVSLTLPQSISLPILGGVALQIGIVLFFFGSDET